MGDIYTKIEREEKELIIKGFKYYLNIKDYDKRMKLMQEFLQIMQENQNDQINSPTNDISKNISCNNEEDIGNNNKKSENQNHGIDSNGNKHVDLLKVAENNGVEIAKDKEDKEDKEDTAASDEKTSEKDVSLYALEKKIQKKNNFIVRNDLLYYYDEFNHYYKLVSQDDIIRIYRSTVSHKLNRASSFRIYNDLYRILKTDPWLKVNDDPDENTYCSLQDHIYGFDDYGEYYYMDHGPDNITFTCLDASYTSDIKCPVFKKFIKDITHDRKELKNRLLMALGYLLVETKKGKFFFLAGFEPDTGKSVLFNFIQRLFPPEAVSNLPIGDLGGRFESESLLTSRINISLDLPQEPLSASAVAKIKQLTGGDTVEVQRKNKTSKKIDHPVKLVFASNHPIVLKRDDKAFWNRLIYLPFKYPVENKDPELGNKLWDERDSIVSYLLSYAYKLEKLHYEFPTIPEDSIKELKHQGPVDFLQGFIDECCIVGDYHDFCPTAKLKEAYENYCEENMFPTCTRTQFINFMENHGVYSKRTSNVRGFTGIRLCKDV